ncbi:diguanylate cyclase [Modestobacter muralis]|uniref:Diguanylate cyclase n=1 Tax=Modestobacter muralis TaxID=1608614 RepID=A0A6P0F2V8_9ACTN|nr:diguanylate cyclase [Modestobacter muralis]NEN53334.1 diguanylate cyclase [Modestobacter muralis]
MTRVRRAPLTAVLLAALLALAVTVPFSAHGPGPEWDNMVLVLVGGWAAWHAHRLTRRMRRRDRLPWQVLGASALLFALASLVSGLGTGVALGDLGLGDLLVLLAAFGPPVSAALLGGRVRGTNWPLLVVDGVMVAFALVVVADVLVLSPALSPGAVRGDLLPLVIGYGVYPALAIGLVGALCTVSTAAVRRPATAVTATTVLVGASSALQAVYIVVPSTLWAGAADAAVVAALVVAVRAVRLAVAAAGTGVPSDTTPVVNAAGVAVQVAALVGVPVTLVAAIVLDMPVHDGAIACTAVVITMLLVRIVLRIRESGRVQADLVRSEDDFRGLVEASSDGVAIVDAELRLEFTSPAARTLLGVLDSDLHPSLLDLLHDGDRTRVRHELTVGTGEVAPALHLRVQDAGGEPRELEVTHHERPGSGRRVLHLRDVTTRRRRERELERMAFTDHLTRLPNRAMLFQEMAAPTTPGGQRCLLVLDLDGFKAVNESAGHEAGDLLLVEVARRLQSLLRTDDLVARLGGDEFAVLVAGAEEDAVEAAQRVVDVLAHPYRVGNRSFSVGASVGLARLNPGGGQVAFRQADAALGAAKQAGKGCWRVHTDDLVGQAAASSDVLAAIAAGEVQLRYDVVSTSDTGEVYGLHSAPVWAHPELGVLPAPELWAAAERQGCNGVLQQWLLRRACAEVAALDGELTLGFDLPAGQVHADELAGEVAAALAEAGMVPRQLALAFDEEVLQTSSAGLIPALHTVRAAGVHLCLNDFGMGSTLWSQLARVPLDTVRVDVRGLAAPGDHDRTMRVLSAIESSAAAFDVYTFASGVGSPELYEAIRAQCQMAVTGPVLPTGLTADQVAALLRHPSAAGAAALLV